MPVELQDRARTTQGLAHEVRNHLGAILNAVALMRRGAANLEDLCTIVEEEALAIHDLVDCRRSAAGR